MILAYAHSIVFTVAVFGHERCWRQYRFNSPEHAKVHVKNAYGQFSVILGWHGSCLAFRNRDDMERLNEYTSREAKTLQNIYEVRCARGFYVFVRTTIFSRVAWFFQQILALLYCSIINKKKKIFKEIKKKKD